MFKHKKLSFILLGSIIFLTACGSQPLIENVPGDTGQIPSVTSPEHQPSLVQEEIISNSTARLTYPIVDTDQGIVTMPKIRWIAHQRDQLSSGRMPNITETSPVTRIMAMVRSRIT